MFDQVDILGVRVSCIDPPQALAFFDDAIASGARTYVCITGVHGVMESRRDPDLAAIHRAAGLVTPDGMPMVWAGRVAGSATIRRVYGPDLVELVAAEAPARGWRSFFYGGQDGVPERLAATLEAANPGLAVAGTFSPPFRPLDDGDRAEHARIINASGADIVWVGLSTPKQERWMAAMRPLLDAPVLVGVGAAFDIVSGLVPQAPRWVQRSGFEWLFRLGTEPRRLWRRYLSNNPRFVVAICRHRPTLVSVGSTAGPAAAPTAPAPAVPAPGGVGTP